MQAQSRPADYGGVVAGPDRLGDLGGRRLPGLLRAAGLGRVRLLTDVYQDTTLAPFSKSFLERRAENAVRFGLVTPATAQDWLDAFTALVAGGAFVLTMNYYGAVGVKPGVTP